MARRKVAINGFGRIGRLSLRSYFMHGGEHEYDIVAVNDLTPPASLAYLLKYDSVFRRFPGTVELSGDTLIVNGKSIKAVAEPDPTKLPWKDMDIDVVIESTGRFTAANKAKAHIEAGAKKVLIVEEDLTAQLRELFAIHFDCHDKLLSLLQYDGTPFTTSTIVNKAKEVF